MSSTKRKSTSPETASAKKKKGSRGPGAIRELVEDEFGGNSLAFLKHLDERLDLSSTRYMALFDEKYKKGFQNLNQIKRQMKGDADVVLGTEWKTLINDYSKQKKGSSTPSKRAAAKTSSITPERSGKKAKTGDSKKKAPASDKKRAARGAKKVPAADTSKAESGNKSPDEESIAEPPLAKKESSKGSGKAKTSLGEEEETQGAAEGAEQVEVKTAQKVGFFSQHPWLMVIAGYVALLLLGYGIVYFSCNLSEGQTMLDGTSHTAPSSTTGDIGSGGKAPHVDAADL